MSRDPHFQALERMYLAAPINRIYRPTIEVRSGEAEIEIVLAEKYFHSGGAVHGSVYFKMLDDAAFFAAHSLVDDVFIVTATFQTYLLRPTSEGRLISRGRVVHRSRRLITADADLVDEQGRQLARGSGTFMRSRGAVLAEMGYR